MTQHGIFHPYSIEEREKRRRMNVVLWAYAYEIMDNPLVSDADFDQQCRFVNLSINTDRPDLDEWFRKNFDPCTGSWIRSYPEIDKLEKLYERVRGAVDEFEDNKRR